MKRTTGTPLLLGVVVAFTACGQDPDIEAVQGATQASLEQPCHTKDARAAMEARASAVLDQMEHGHAAALVANLAWNATWIQTGKEDETPFAGTYTGRREIERMLAHYFAAVKIRSMDRQFDVVADHVLDAHINVAGKIRETGKTFDLEYLYSFVFDDLYEVVEVRAYYCTYSFDLAFTPGGDGEVVDIKGSTDPWDVHLISTDPMTVVQAFYAALESSDVNTLFSLTAPDVVASLKGAVGTTPYAGVFVGPQGVLQMMAAFFSSAQYTAPMEFERIVAEGNTVDVMFIEHVLALPTGKTHVIRVTQVFKLDDDGLITEWKSYNDSEDVYRTFLP